MCEGFGTKNYYRVYVHRYGILHAFEMMGIFFFFLTNTQICFNDTRVEQCGLKIIRPFLNAISHIHVIVYNAYVYKKQITRTPQFKIKNFVLHLLFRVVRTAAVTHVVCSFFISTIRVVIVSGPRARFLISSYATPVIVN